jgi:hypothetical protein
MDKTGSLQSPVVGYSEHGKEPSIIGGELFWLAELLSASREEFCSMELVV